MSPANFNWGDEVYFMDDGVLVKAVMIINYWAENYALCKRRKQLPDGKYVSEEFYVDKSNLTQYL